jgi:Cu+-exporting ATPase
VLKKINLQVGGMTCASCVANVEVALSMLPGVKKVVVNLATGKVAVGYDSEKVSLAEMKKAVDEIGYEVVIEFTA